MQLDLFNTNLLLVVTMLLSVLATVFVLLFGRTAYYWRRLCVALLIATLAFGATVIIIAATLTLSETPGAGYYLLFAAYELIGLFAVQVKRHPTRRDWQRMTSGVASILLCLLLFCLVVNDFYHYFPTPASLLPHHYAAYKDDLQTITQSAIRQNDQTSSTTESSAQAKNLLAGKFYTITIPGTVSHFNARPGLVYVPYAYTHKTDGTAAFPVLVLLNGTPGSPIDWINGVHLQQTLDDFATEHNGFAPLVVIPDHGGQYNADTECVNSSHGNVETYLTVDVPSYVRSHFRASSEASNWGLGGFSEGGYCAAMLTLRHQTIYNHFLDMSGDSEATVGPSPALALQQLFHGSTADMQQHDVDWLLANAPLNSNLTGQFVIARNDEVSLVDGMEATYRNAKSQGMSVSLEVIPQGGHSFALWAQGFKDALPELSYELGVTNF